MNIYIPDNIKLHINKNYDNDIKFENSFYVLKDEYNQNIASIEVCFMEEEKNLNINYVSTIREYRGNGIATFLIYYALNDYKDKIDNVTLDDCSDKPWGNDNIYIKIGFLYIDKYCGPEMIATPETILKNKHLFETKYKNNAFFK
jgi:predicted GNAT family acetyltransferase